ncbi:MULTISPECIES: septum site-determining protein MinC [Pantoea]|jgi:septum site-determining protein MinC|uniref:Probable septum site-determining protein MinC n=1 Tax=Pantoea anthophila TaxID=470931 RepID=A0ABY2ZFN3_9GAMM|nr:MULTISPECIES: septum site-determining protein MinC [Pantoea]KAF6655941.1 septum site-determining protein MinC [Enterobacteriaceae bacterium EKM102V]TPE19694.1 septum site-determining protein MinC [Pantoea vagans]EIB98587.1 septum formation inhibitor [Pantoea sp. Sc1]KAA5972043.1 septum site-determining protein MinC [Pantoea sp. M_6]KAA5977314.1 septum site-determining protein MinC [Pantoea sp. M_8]
MSQTPIEFKGSSFTLSVVHLHHHDPAVIRKALQDKIDQAPDFLKNAPVVLNVATLSADVNWKQLQQAILATGLRIVGVSGCKDEALKRMIARAGLPVLAEGKEARPQVQAPAPAAVPEPQPVAAEAVAAKTRIVNTPVRSGQQIYARDADLIITSSVSAGAELVADGNIHIYGMMRGRALAGASGDRNCQIFCTNLAAELVSIAGEYWIMDQIPQEFFGKAARLCLQDGALTIQTLN